ncbi:iron chelate uptake ABC transporter family permease subunit [Rhodococcus hoagii]|nr:iron chelate uptake ABC transporter family permease subunit [Prescottella equi]
MLAWDNPLPVGSPGFWRVAELRANSLVVIAIVVICQAMATVAFQSATNNRIITPSIMGFEALYVAVQTASVFFLGAAGVVALQGVPQFALQLTIMVVFAMLLYGWLLSGKYGNMQVMLLVGIILGGGARVGVGIHAAAADTERIRRPHRQTVRLDLERRGGLPAAGCAPVCLAAGGSAWWRARRLNLVAMGRDVTTNLGLDHRREVMIVLFLVSVLMAVSTALIGPMTFLGFWSHAGVPVRGHPDHRYIFPVAVLTGFVILTGRLRRAQEHLLRPGRGVDHHRGRRRRHVPHRDPAEGRL